MLARQQSELLVKRQEADRRMEERARALKSKADERKSLQEEKAYLMEKQKCAMLSRQEAIRQVGLEKLSMK
jgi:hypothetical protein